VEIEKKIDKSNLRKESDEKNIPILELLFQKLAGDEKTPSTLLAVCPNSETVLEAAIRAAKRADAPILFAATLNQVDIDRGYTGWTPGDLIRKIKEKSYGIDYNGPTIVGIDHGGPWAKDRQTTEKWDLDRSMDWMKKSFEAAIEAGYDMIHIDPTIDIFNRIEIDKVVERTIELLTHSEDFRKSKGLKPISYEVGTEEVHGGLVDMKVFEKFLNLLKKGLGAKKLDKAWPIFIVAKVGTDLHTTTFDPKVARDVVERAKVYGSYIKGHYTDFVENPCDYTKSGIGAANVGPEFTMMEYDALNELCIIEEKLYKKNYIGLKSKLMDSLEKAVIDSGRWRKWLKEGEKDINSIPRERKDWIIKTSARYVWANPEVKCSQNMLFKNLELNGIDGEGMVLLNIEKSIDKYYREFNLINLNHKLDL
jgi:D-tagatose-1,6-bisphosphate aldolase subunit GatZ/KbaZ